jgi:sporulation protein YlmC with PRC-barrel domain
MPGGNVNETGRRVIDAGLHLLDRQIVDKDGKLAGKVDDLDLTFPHGSMSDPPFVSAILSGRGGLAPQIGGRLGKWIAAAESRLSGQPAPGRISFGLVNRIGNHVQLTVSRDDLDVTHLEDWLRDTIISKIPGARHAPQ